MMCDTAASLPSQTQGDLDAGAWKTLRQWGNSPGDFEAVHSLAASGENTLKGQSRHFVHGCTETVQRHRGGENRRGSNEKLGGASNSKGEAQADFEI